MDFPDASSLVIRRRHGVKDRRVDGKRGERNAHEAMESYICYIGMNGIAGLFARLLHVVALPVRSMFSCLRIVVVKVSSCE